ncbi:MAG: fasciclin domain-containing protein, partial [Pseudomonadota bacterium]
MKLATLLISASLLAAPAVAEQCSSKNNAHRVDASYSTAIAGEGYTKAKADIVDTAAAAGSFSTLLAAAEAAGLVGALKGDG